MSEKESPKAGEKEAKEKKIELPKTEKPLGLEQEKAAEAQAQVAPVEDTQVIYRKFDSDDMVRIRSGSLITEVENQNKDPQQQDEAEIDLKERLSVDMGMLQKISICLGVQSCPWFSDVINEEVGVTEEIYARRMRKEFRRFPVEFLDKAFKEAQKYNKAEFNAADLKKK